MRDRNLRVHLAAGVLAGAFVAFAPLAAAERAVILVCIALVICAEAANTALEAIVDLVSPEWNERARIAKDAAAAAVLAVAAGSVLAFVVIAAGRWDELVAAWPALRRPASVAAVAALMAGALPWRSRRRSSGHDVALALVAVLSWVQLAFAATSHAGVAAMALCLAVSISAAVRKRRVAPPP